MKPRYKEIDGGARITLLYPLLHVLHFKSVWGFHRGISLCDIISLYPEV